MGILVFWLVFPGTYELAVLLLALVFGILLVDSLRITVTGTGERTTLAGIVRLVEPAQALALTGPSYRRPRGFLAHFGGARRRGADSRWVAGRRRRAAYAVERLVTVGSSRVRMRSGLPCRWSLRLRRL